ncbi:MAG: hypothetical protein RLY87_1501, partial [Chloroflexota bacterium]
GFFVALPRGEVERAGDFFVEQRVAHRVADVRIDTERPFTEVASAFVRVEDFVEFGGVGAGLGLDDFALVEFEVDVGEQRAAIEGFAVVGNVAFNGCFDGAGVDFAVGDVAFAEARHHADTFDAEAQIGARPFDVDLIGAAHQCLEGFHGALHGVIVDTGADIEVVILKGFGAHPGGLCHRG